MLLVLSVCLLVYLFLHKLASNMPGRNWAPTPYLTQVWQNKIVQNPLKLISGFLTTLFCERVFAPGTYNGIDRRCIGSMSDQKGLLGDAPIMGVNGIWAGPSRPSNFHSNCILWYSHKAKCLSSKENKKIHESYRNLAETLIIRVIYWRTVDVLCVGIFLWF